jgi:hypothetical protein
LGTVLREAGLVAEHKSVRDQIANDHRLSSLHSELAIQFYDVLVRQAREFKSERGLD